MTNAWKIKIAIAVGVILIGGFGATMLLRGNLRDWIASTYTRSDTATKKANASTENKRGRDSVVYTSADKPTEVAKTISKKWKPAEEKVTPSGTFLRYSKDFVAVTPNGDKGSKITVDDERRGYAMWYPFIGGWWGTYSGPGESFRGGGPGSGK